MIIRIAKLLTSAAAFGGACCGSTLALDHFEFIDMTDYPIFRAARTSLTTISIIADYKYSLQGLNHDSPDYSEVKSQVGGVDDVNKVKL